MIDKTRVFETYGIFISIVFARNLDREPAWRFVIEDIEDQKFESGRFKDYEQCVKESLKKALDYI